MNLDDIEIRDDQQGRVLEIVLVLEELEIRGGEIGPLALVLPGEVPSIPDVRPAISATGLLRTALEGIELAGRIDIGGGGDAEDGAEVVEVGLRGGALLEGTSDPLSLEGDGVQGVCPCAR